MRTHWVYDPKLSVRVINCHLDILVHVQPLPEADVPGKKTESSEIIEILIYIFCKVRVAGSCLQASEAPGTVPHSYQQEHAKAREFSAATLPAVRCAAPWWLPAQVGVQQGSGSRVKIASRACLE